LVTDDLAAVLLDVDGTLVESAGGRGARPRPGIPELLDEFASEHVRLGVVTTGSRAWVEPLLHGLFGLDRFEVIVTGDDVARRKPHPAAFLRAVEMLGLRAGSEIVALEDSDNGVRAAKAAGLSCIVVVNDLTARGVDAADLVLDSFGAGSPPRSFHDPFGVGPAVRLDVATFRAVARCGANASAIRPDDKDWTWVLERVCAECSFDASNLRHDAVAGLVGKNARDWADLLTAGRVRSGRPDSATWSSLEYACHVRDVFRRYDARVELMVSEPDPLFPNWDQGASAVDDRYEAQDPSAVVGELGAAAVQLAERLNRLDDDEWQRPGRRSDGASFTVATIVRYMAHDVIHHIWDVAARPADVRAR